MRRLSALALAAVLTLTAATGAGTIAAAADTPTVTVSADTAELRFGDTTHLTASLGAAVTGSVTFVDTAATGPAAGRSVVLGSGPATGGVAALAVVLPTFGAHQVVARYGGDALHDPAVSVPIEVEVTAWEGELIISEVRGSGPSGAGDAYLELFNTGPPVPLSGFRIQSGDAVVDLDADAPTLGQHRHYLVAGPDFSLGRIATPDRVGSLGRGGWRILAPDTGRTRTDAVGPSAGFHRGTGLASLAATPTEQYGFVRVQRAGRPVDTGDNRADFALVSATGGTVGGVASMLGSPSPTGSADPYQRNEALTSYMVDPPVAVDVAPNRIYRAGTPGRLRVIRSVMNLSSETITSARVRVTALSEDHGTPKPGVAQQPSPVARLRLVEPWSGPVSEVSTLGRGRLDVNNLSPGPPIAGGSGGGLNSTLEIPLPEYGLLPYHWVDIAFSFEVDSRGSFWFGYDIDARTKPTPLRRGPVAQRVLTRAERGPATAYATGRL